MELPNGLTRPYLSSTFVQGTCPRSSPFSSSTKPIKGPCAPPTKSSFSIDGRVPFPHWLKVARGNHQPYPDLSESFPATVSTIEYLYIRGVLRGTRASLDKVYFVHFVLRKRRKSRKKKKKQGRTIMWPPNNESLCYDSFTSQPDLHKRGGEGAHEPPNSFKCCLNQRLV